MSRVMAVSMPLDVLLEMWEAAVSWLRETPTALLVIAAVVVLVLGMQVIDRVQLWREHRRAMKAHRLTMERLRKEWPALMRQRAAELRVVAKRMERDGDAS